jgi:hypothetical protein
VGPHISNYEKVPKEKSKLFDVSYIDNHLTLQSDLAQAEIYKNKNFLYPIQVKISTV